MKELMQQQIIKNRLQFAQERVAAAQSQDGAEAQERPNKQENVNPAPQPAPQPAQPAPVQQPAQPAPQPVQVQQQPEQVQQPAQPAQQQAPVQQPVQQPVPQPAPAPQPAPVQQPAQAFLNKNKHSSPLNISLLGIAAVTGIYAACHYLPKIKLYIESLFIKKKEATKKPVTTQT
ncbi:MAG: hypothetical protein NT124_03480 [Candidatus Dependentiae bacterium]|nr:hypothetical protein [Candidatus Dependentiae bacterium]